MGVEGEGGCLFGFRLSPVRGMGTLNRGVGGSMTAR